MRKLLIIMLLLVALAVLASLALAQSGGFELVRQTLSGGGGTLEDGFRFALDGTIGQVVASHSEDGTRFELESGFLSDVNNRPGKWEVYVPVILR